MTSGKNTPMWYMGTKRPWFLKFCDGGMGRLLLASSAKRYREFTAKRLHAEAISSSFFRTPRFACSLFGLQVADEIRDYSISHAASFGWEVRLEENRTARRLDRYQDWHRVE